MAQQLTRSSDHIVAGVAGGIAKYLNVDASIVRVVTFLLVAFTGIGPILYVLGWLILPEENTGKTGLDALTGGAKKAKESYDSNKLHNPEDLR